VFESTADGSGRAVTPGFGTERTGPVSGTRHYGAAMSAERISPVVPVDDLAAAVTVWSAVLGVDPTFVDGDRWAQFDVGGSRLALAGTDRASDEPGVMIKVADAAASRDQYQAAGIACGELVEGAHELRFELEGAGLAVTVYSAR
jgi:hypothetical protein